MKVCQVVAKIALTLVQNWYCKHEVIDIKNSKNSKNHHIKRTSFQIRSLKIYSKNNYILLVIEFRRKFEILLSKFIENIDETLVNLTIQMESSIQNLLFASQSQNILPKYFFIIIFSKCRFWRRLSTLRGVKYKISFFRLYNMLEHLVSVTPVEFYTHTTISRAGALKFTSHCMPHKTCHSMTNKGSNDVTIDL